jgi:multidrug transporter EmrE-like cation transporter
MAARETRMFWLFMVLTLAFDLGGIVAGRYAAERKQPAFFYACIVAFTLVGVSVGLMMQFRGVAIATIVWAGLAPALALLAGYYLFGEQLGIWQLVGTALIIAGVAMVEWPRDEHPNHEPPGPSATAADQSSAQ